MKRSRQNIKKRLSYQRGEIATTLTLIGIGILALGALVGSWAIRYGPLKTGGLATGSPITVEGPEIDSYDEDRNILRVKVKLTNGSQGEYYLKAGIKTASDYVTNETIIYSNLVQIPRGRSHTFTLGLRMTDDWEENECPAFNVQAGYFLGTTWHWNDSVTLFDDDKEKRFCPTAPTPTPTEEAEPTNTPTPTTPPESCRFAYTAQLRDVNNVVMADVSGFQLDVGFGPTPFPMERIVTENLDPEKRGTTFNARLYLPEGEGYRIEETFCLGTGCPEHIETGRESINGLNMDCGLDYTFGWRLSKEGESEPTVPSPPTDLIMSCPSDGSDMATFRWRNVSGVTHYILRINKEPREDWYNGEGGDIWKCIAASAGATTSVEVPIEIGSYYSNWNVQSSNDNCAARDWGQSFDQPRFVCSSSPGFIRGKVTHNIPDGSRVEESYFCVERIKKVDGEETGAEIDPDSCDAKKSVVSGGGITGKRSPKNDYDINEWGNGEPILKGETVKIGLIAKYVSGEVSEIISIPSGFSQSVKDEEWVRDNGEEFTVGGVGPTYEVDIPGIWVDPTEQTVEGEANCSTQVSYQVDTGINPSIIRTIQLEGVAMDEHILCGPPLDESKKCTLPVTDSDILAGSSVEYRLLDTNSRPDKMLAGPAKFTCFITQSQNTPAGADANGDGVVGDVVDWSYAVTHFGETTPQGVITGYTVSAIYARLTAF